MGELVSARLRTAALVLTVGLSACAPATRLTATWKDPSVPPPMKFTKILLVAQMSDQAIRRSIETRLAQRLSNAQPSYTVLSDAEAKSENHGKDKIAAAGYDGAVVIRFARVDKQTTYVPGTTWWGPAPYGTWWGGYGYGWGMAYSPGYVQRDTVVAVEANVYPSSRINCSGQAEAKRSTRNPHSSSWIRSSTPPSRK